MEKRTLLKPDGRRLWLYAEKDLAQWPDSAPAPKGIEVQANPQMRYHPLRDEWVAYAAYRQNRTFHPPKEYNPLAPTRSVDFPTELPPGDYQVAVFENLFPTLSDKAHEVAGSLPLPVPTQPARGVCEVVVYTQREDAALATLSLSHIELLLEVWGDRVRQIADEHAYVKYVMPFENRGVEVGVTLSHPHGQIYAYPLVPPVPARQLEQSKRFFEKNSRSLLESLIEAERADGRRILYAGPEATAWVPAFARYPYEVWVAPTRAVERVDLLSAEQRRDFARALKTVLLKYEKLWDRPFPYLMAFSQGPVNDGAHPEAHFHLEFYPPYRSRDRLKYLAGTELGAGFFASDALPEEKAAELQKVEVKLD